MAGCVMQIGGREVTYIAADEVLGPEDAEAVGFDFSEDTGFRSHARLRRVLTMMVRSAPKFYGVLHWSDGSDLNLLDEKVRSGQPDDADLAGALLAEPRTIVCRACQAQVRVLAVDTGQALSPARSPGACAAMHCRRHAWRAGNLWACRSWSSSASSRRERRQV